MTIDSVGQIVKQKASALKGEMEFVAEATSLQSIASLVDQGHCEVKLTINFLGRNFVPGSFEVCLAAQVELTAGNYAIPR